MIGNKGDISKKILTTILMIGVISIAATSPFFVSRIFKKYFKQKKYKKRQITNSFSYLKNRGFISVKKRNHQIYVSLTKEGKKKIDKYQIDNLKIEKSIKWDKKWRIIIFDIAHYKKLLRDVFRGKLKELEFYQLQKSVWISPYPCDKEINLLREFYGAEEGEIIIIEADKIEKEYLLKEKFKLL